MPDLNTDLETIKVEIEVGFPKLQLLLLFWKFICIFTLAYARVQHDEWKGNTHGYNEIFN